ncbi:hypothetical protein [Tahibacter amnicola]|uniref:Uncharacterized protein n=1 Tax=Tahibacter amnicola TaxID=2976241 RepID=A0ABY6BJW4_9GAMM|nr:hypothetical protein [Tahibacter amnicola]UXI68082.1 hypothetical protein N4264_00055 [Tahibacter amnicola]
MARWSTTQNSHAQPAGVATDFPVNAVDRYKYGTIFEMIVSTAPQPLRAWLAMVPVQQAGM